MVKKEVRVYRVLIGFNEALTNVRHEPGELIRADKLDVPDVHDLLSRGTIQLLNIDEVAQAADNHEEGHV